MYFILLLSLLLAHIARCLLEYDLGDLTLARFQLSFRGTWGLDVASFCSGFASHPKKQTSDLVLRANFLEHLIRAHGGAVALYTEAGPICGLRCVQYCGLHLSEAASLFINFYSWIASYIWCLTHHRPVICDFHRLQKCDSKTSALQHHSPSCLQNNPQTPTPERQKQVCSCLVVPWPCG